MLFRRWSPDIVFACNFWCGEWQYSSWQVTNPCVTIFRLLSGTKVQSFLVSWRWKIAVATLVIDATWSRSSGPWNESNRHWHVLPGEEVESTLASSSKHFPLSCSVASLFSGLSLHQLLFTQKLISCSHHDTWVVVFACSCGKWFTAEHCQPVVASQCISMWSHEGRNPYGVQNCGSPQVSWSVPHHYSGLSWGQSVCQCAGTQDVWVQFLVLPIICSLSLSKCLSFHMCKTGIVILILLYDTCCNMGIMCYVWNWIGITTALKSFHCQNIFHCFLLLF